MEEGWDIVNSLNSSLNHSQHTEKSTLLELDFNRFENQPEFQIEDEYPEEYPEEYHQDAYSEGYDQQLMDEGVIFSDSLPPEEEYEEEEEREPLEYKEKKEIDQVEYEDKEINFTLGDSKLINNDTMMEQNNEREEQRTLAYKNSILSPFFLSNNRTHFMSDKSTRESDLDKEATWESTQEAGPSVPYIAPPKPIEKTTPTALPTFARSKFSFGPSNPTAYKATEEEIAERLKMLQLDSSTNEVDQLDISNPSDGSSNSEQDKPRPIKVPKSRRNPITNSLTEQSMPAFAATPKTKPLLSLEQLHVVDIPPYEETESEVMERLSHVSSIEPYEHNESEDEPEDIKDMLRHCLKFSPEHQSHFTAVYLDLLKLVPQERTWYTLKQLNLSRQHLKNIHDLKTCFPLLETLDLSHNELKSISGLPVSIRKLFLSHNKLDEIDIYQLDRLHHLDISNNYITQFEDLSELKSLVTVDASNNNFNSCKSFQTLDNVVSLSLRGNKIRKLDGLMHTYMENLDLSHNRIECLEGLELMKDLRSLDLDHNFIKTVQLDQPLTKLCKLKMSFNRLKALDVSPFPEVRTLYLDENQIERIIGAACINRLESFSLRDQGRQKAEFNIQYFRYCRKLYLSGSPFNSMNQMVDFFSLETLELCSAGIEKLPPDFGKMVPNLVNLYLSMNRLQETRPLKRLKYLKRLILIGNRFLSVAEIITTVRHLKKLTLLDLRQNPICSNLYPPIDTSLRHRTTDKDETVSPYVYMAHDPFWEALDMDFRMTLSDHWCARRDVYRAFLTKACPKLDRLDHLQISVHERSLIDQIIDEFNRSRPSKQNPV